MDFTYDKEVNALYITISKNKIVQTISLDDNIFLDVDSDNKPVGIEYLLSKELPGKALEILHNLDTNSVEFQINECLADLGKWRLY